MPTRQHNAHLKTCVTSPTRADERYTPGTTVLASVTAAVEPEYFQDVKYGSHFPTFKQYVAKAEETVHIPVEDTEHVGEVQLFTHRLDDEGRKLLSNWKYELRETKQPTTAPLPSGMATPALYPQRIQEDSFGNKSAWSRP